MIASFMCEDGKVREGYFHSYKDACATGDKMRFEAISDGLSYIGTRISKPPIVRSPSYRFVSHQPKRWDPDAPHHTKTGKTAFNTQQEREDWQAKKAAKGEIWVID